MARNVWTKWRRLFLWKVHSMTFVVVFNWTSMHSHFMLIRLRHILYLTAQLGLRWSLFVGRDLKPFSFSIYITFVRCIELLFYMIRLYPIKSILNCELSKLCHEVDFRIQFWKNMQQTNILLQRIIISVNVFCYMLVKTTTIYPVTALSPGDCQMI